MKTLTIKEVAEKWELSERHVQSLCKSGAIYGVRKYGRSWMIPDDAIKPIDGRTKEAKDMKNADSVFPNQPLVRKSPFLDMTDLYSVPGSADECIEKLTEYPEAQALFAAEIAYSRGEIDRVMKHTKEFLSEHSGFYAIISTGMLLSLCALWRGDVKLWREAKKYICEAPCKTDTDREIMALTLAAANSAVYDTEDFPDWFKKGNFEKLPSDAHPAARVYYIKYLLISAKALAVREIELDGVYGLGLMRTIPYIVQPMITQAVSDKTIMTEIYLRLLCAISYHYTGDDSLAIYEIDKALDLALPDMLLGPLAEHRRMLDNLLDDRLKLKDTAALKNLRELHKQLSNGWTHLNNNLMGKTISHTLSSREREAARLAAFGLSNQQIARRMSIEVTSVKTLLLSAGAKTGAADRSEFAFFI